jgi:hypothetical protein
MEKSTSLGEMFHVFCCGMDPLIEELNEVLVA